MKQALLFCLAAILLAGPSSCEDEGDAFDLNKWIEDKEKVQQFIECVTGVSDKCSEKDLVWKEIILSKCEECTAEQKEMYDKGFDLFAEKYPDWAKTLKDKESK